MNILIMVLSFDQPPFDLLMRTQQETWDSLGHDIAGIRTMYYHGGGKTEPYLWHYDGRLELPCTDDYYLMAHKFRLALDYAFEKIEFDLIFRTNSSSYVNKKKLLERAELLPQEKLYAGWTFHDSNSEDKGMCVSGAGIWLSRDTADILRNDIDPHFEQEEDVYCGRLLRNRGIVAIDDKSRYDVPVIVPNNIPTDRYHYRCKSGSLREIDANNMRIIHEKIKAQ